MSAFHCLLGLPLFLFPATFLLLLFSLRLLICQNMKVGYWRYANNYFYYITLHYITDCGCGKSAGCLAVCLTWESDCNGCTNCCLGGWGINDTQSMSLHLCCDTRLWSHPYYSNDIRPSKPILLYYVNRSSIPLHRANVQLGLNRAAQHELERDASDKFLAESLDSTCHLLRNTSRGLAYHDGVHRIDNTISVPETWAKWVQYFHRM